MVGLVGLARAAAEYHYEAEGGLAAGIILLIFLLAIAFYVLYCWLLYRIGKKMNYDKNWMAWVPIAQIYMLGELAGKDTTFIVIMIVGSFVCGIVGAVMQVIAFMALAERMGKESWWGILTIIPIVNFIAMYVIGNGQPVQYYQPAAAYQAAPGYYPPQQGYPTQQVYPPQQGYQPPPPPPQGYQPPPPPPPPGV